MLRQPCTPIIRALPVQRARRGALPARSARKVDVVSSPVRVLRWSYASTASRCSCDISLDSTNLLYALRIGDIRVEPAAPADDRRQATVTVELYLHVARALERQCEIEADMLQRGFHLDSFTAETPNG